MMLLFIPSGIVFGTSGACGLVKDFTPQALLYGLVCCRYGVNIFP